MNIFRIGIAKLFSRPFNTGLSILLFAIGVAIISLLINFEAALNGQLSKNLAGIDMVVGAKGSPLQLILSSVFHVDVPTGNIPLAEAERIAKNPMVEKTIPIALGDNYSGYRIVGTSPDLADLYAGEIENGRLYQKSAEVTIGYTVAEKTGLTTGSTFSGVHGFMEQGHAHDYFVYEVTGIFKKTGTVLDNLILTPVESVWSVHGNYVESVEHEHVDCDHDHEHDEDCNHEPDHTHHPLLEEIVAKVEAGEDLTHEEMLIYSEHKNLLASRAYNPSEEITALLVFFNSPVANVLLPRLINETTNMQAAVPAFELNRLLGFLGVGINALRWLAWIIIIISGINIFVHLLNTLNQSAYEIALIRVLGTPPYKVLIMLLSQGIFLALAGWIAGLLISRVVWLAFPAVSGLSLGLIPLVTGHELILLLYTIAVGIAGSLVPAVLAYKTNIHQTLSKS